MFTLERIVALCGFGLAVVACGDPTTQPSATPTSASSNYPLESTVPGTWQKLPSLLPKRAYMAAAVSDKSILVIGGYVNTAYPLTRVDAYNVETRTWTRLKPLPEPRFWHGANTIHGKVYVAGGATVISDPADPDFGDPRPHKTLFVYDPASDSWTRKADMPLPVNTSLQASLLGKLYVYTPDHFWVYVPGSDRWFSRPLPPSEHDLGGMVALDGKLYLTGGLRGAPVNPWNSELDVYDPATNTWAVKSPMLWPGGTAAVGAFHGKLWVTGVQVLDTGGVVEVYDPVTDQWRYGPTMLESSFYGATAWAGGKFFVFSGYNGDGALTGTVQALSTPY